jgi:hypothetical protein
MSDEIQLKKCERRKRMHKEENKISKKRKELNLVARVTKSRSTKLELPKSGKRLCVQKIIGRKQLFSGRSGRKKDWAEVTMFRK